MKLLVDRLDNLLLTPDNFTRFTVTALAGGWSEDLARWQTEESASFPTEAEAAARFHALIDSGKYHTVTCWAYEREDDQASQLYTEVDTWSTLAYLQPEA